MTYEPNDLEREILHEGLDDWVPLLTVERCVRIHHGPELQPAAKVGTIVEVVSRLLDAGLVEIGDLSSGSFSPWPVPNDVAVSRIRDALEAAVEEGQWGFAAWLSNMPEGDSIGQQFQPTDGDSSS